MMTDEGSASGQVRDISTRETYSADLDTTTTIDLTTPASALQGIYLFIQGYIIPFLLLLGMTGNILSLVVFIRVRKRADASVQYLSTLAVSDTGFIVFIGILDWVSYGLGYVTDGRYAFDFYTHSNATCKFMGFFRRLLEMASAWAIVAFTVERVYIVWFPLKRSRITSNMRLSIIITIWILTIGLSVHRIILNHVYIEFGVAICWFNANPVTQIILFQVDTTIHNYMPSFLICLSNIAILIGIRRSKKSFDSTNKMVAKTDSQDGRLVVSLMLVSTLYVILMTPSSLAATYFFYLMGTGKDVDPILIDSVYYAVTFLDQFTLVNYCVNFIIYGCTLPFFKEEVKRIFRMKKQLSR
jgi:hypothetical protein